jgi:hypothetical protein
MRNAKCGEGGAGLFYSAFRILRSAFNSPPLELRGKSVNDRGMEIRPTIGITMGEPAGIGAEVIVKALADPALRRRARYVIFGMNELLHYAADLGVRRFLVAGPIQRAIAGVSA